MGIFYYNFQIKTFDLLGLFLFVLLKKKEKVCSGVFM